ncbi:MAG TPA: hypothetical protein ENK28_08395 [Aliiroseovarius sp.]|nr:hypothetical protein [Aliiroseovarius sp.]
MKFRSAVLAVLLTSGAALAQEMPDGVTQADLDAFQAAMITQGCVIDSEDKAVAVEDATGFSEDQLSAIVGFLMEAGQMEMNAEAAGIRLLDVDACEG